MIARNAKVTDANDICSLIGNYAQQDQMLFRSMSDIYENLQDFTVVEQNSAIVGCCALQIIWADLAEIKSLAVDKNQKNKGIGKILVEAVAEKAQLLGLKKLFALTLTPDFFQKIGFNIVEKDSLPMKVWSDCAKCPKQQNCDEIAVIRELT